MPPSRTRNHRSEGTFDDLQLAAENGGHIEADLPWPQGAILFQPPGRKPADPGPLLDGDGFSRDPEGVGGAGLHLAEHVGAALAEDEVQFAVSAPPVAGDYLVPAGFIPRRGGVLTGEPERAPVGVARGDV